MLIGGSRSSGSTPSQLELAAAAFDRPAMVVAQQGVERLPVANPRRLPAREAVRLRHGRAGPQCGGMHVLRDLSAWSWNTGRADFARELA